MGTAAYSDVIEGCIKGERKAQKLLYEHLAPKMFSVCLRYMGERKAAEDVLQDAFVTLFSKIDSFSDTGSFDGWARRIFVNTALMSLRKKDALKMRAQRKIPVDLHFIVRLRHKASGAALG